MFVTFFISNFGPMFNRKTKNRLHMRNQMMFFEKTFGNSHYSKPYYTRDRTSLNCNTWGLHVLHCESEKVSYHVSWVSEIFLWFPCSFYNAYPIFSWIWSSEWAWFFCKWPTFSLDFWHEIFSYFFSCSIISSMYLKNDVYFCVFRSVKPLLHDSKCEKLVPKNGRKQWNKLQKIKVRKILNTITVYLQSVYLFRLLGVLA